MKKINKLSAVCLCLLLIFGYAGTFGAGLSGGVSVLDVHAMDSVKVKNENDNKNVDSNGLPLPYHFYDLNGAEQSVYLSLRTAILNCEPSVTFNFQLTQQLLARMNILMTMYDPLTFNVANISGLAYRSRTTLNIEYKYPKETYFEMLAEVNSVTAEILSNITQDMAELDVLKYFYDVIILNSEYDLKSANGSNIYGVLVEGKGMCIGYSQTFTYLCSLLNIPTTVVLGDDPKGGKIGHNWNKVFYENNWYNVDVTFGVHESSKIITYEFFMVDDSALVKTHLETRRPVFKSPKTK